MVEGWLFAVNRGAGIEGEDALYDAGFFVVGDVFSGGAFSVSVGDTAEDDSAGGFDGQGVAYAGFGRGTGANGIEKGFAVLERVWVVGVKTTDFTLPAVNLDEALGQGWEVVRQVGLCRGLG